MNTSTIILFVILGFSNIFLWCAFFLGFEWHCHVDEDIEELHLRHDDYLDLKERVHEDWKRINQIVIQMTRKK